MWAGPGPVGHRVRNVVVSILLMMAAVGTFLLLSTLVVAVVRAVLGAPRYLRLHGRLFPPPPQGRRVRRVVRRVLCAVLIPKS
ncbi:hypothetical protein GA0070558_113203 [Micromonospora haikouensis]|uniref:Uncharacterized protein n=1 Tax=Micromonospora haikouensis TaxID=686309 RepID=A0A1C4W7T4_9ACTN|nr:hypothetical protein GA0070558_113203 [Micromonospora haikouensis]